jgi:menaquinone-9 beta-reductase
MIYDIIIVGAGPGGSSAAGFLAGQGRSVLLLDKAYFPRDKICGDGLMPQALFWLDKLGCVDEVLAQTNSLVTSADLFVDGAYRLTGHFPRTAAFPGFGVCLERTKFDHILVRHALSRGAVFKPGRHVRKLSWLPHAIEVQADARGKTETYKGRLLIGADGVGSMVSQAIGNRAKSETLVLSMRAYFDGAVADKSPFKLYFDKRLYPGYGWIFIDDSGRANVGFGYVRDCAFPMKRNVRGMFDDFVASNLGGILGHAVPSGKPAGWWESFVKPRSMVADRVMLIGDAGHCAEPMNGAGIHKAIESAYIAASVALHALAAGDCSAAVLGAYSRQWHEKSGLDWRVGELFITIVKNPDLRELYFRLLGVVGELSGHDRGFQDYICGIFSGVIPPRSCLSPVALSGALPLDFHSWSSLWRPRKTGAPAGATRQASSLARDALAIAGRLCARPSTNIKWGAEVLLKTLMTAADATGSFIGFPPGDPSQANNRHV